MSTTPSTSRPDYLVIGTSPAPASARRFDFRVSLVVLGRDNWLFRAAVLEEFYQLGFDEILCVETSPLKYEAEPLLEKCPGIRILVLAQPCTVGEKINLAAQEVRNTHFLLVWDDQKLSEAGLYSKVQKLWQESTVLLLAPELRDGDGREVPGVLVPSLDGNRLRVLPLASEEEVSTTLYPQDFTGLYQRDGFLRTGGFDTSIDEPYWQKSDWGMRCHLWGESLVLGRVFRVELRSGPQAENQSVGPGSLRFYLKNLALRFVGDHAVLPWVRFLRFWRNSGSTFSDCLREFLAVRDWVHAHRYRFRADAKILVERWGTAS